MQSPAIESKGMAIAAIVTAAVILGITLFMVISGNMPWFLLPVVFVALIAIAGLNALARRSNRRS